MAQPQMVDPDLQRRVRAFSDELDRLGYSPEAQFAAFGSLLAATLGMMPRAEQRAHLAAHFAALQSVQDAF